MKISVQFIEKGKYHITVTETTEDGKEITKECELKDLLKKLEDSLGRAESVKTEEPENET